MENRNNGELIAFRPPAALRKRFEEYAEKKGVSKNAALCEMVEKYLDGDINLLRLETIEQATLTMMDMAAILHETQRDILKSIYKGFAAKPKDNEEATKFNTMVDDIICQKFDQARKKVLDGEDVFGITENDTTEEGDDGEETDN